MTKLRSAANSQAIWTMIALATYLVAATVLVLVLHLAIGDALSRVGNAYYVLFSRDPHLGAIGFVWNPLPSFLVMPLLPLGLLWPPLIADGFAGCIVSSVAMALAVGQLAGLLREWGLGLAERTVLTALFAFHPMIVQYGANGDSEALFLLFLVVAARHTSRWMQIRSPDSLVRTGIALALAYLTRYEAAAAALAIGCLVGAITYRDAPGERRGRLTRSTGEMVLLLTPFAFAFSGWALMSWLIVGNPFEQFSSVYGNSAQMALGDVNQMPGLERAAIVGGQILGLQPLIVGIAVAAAGVGWWRGSPKTAAIAATFGSVLAFAIAAWLLGKTGGWLRYYIAVVPLAVLLVAAALPPVTSSAPWARPLDLGRRLRAIPRVLAAVAVVVVGLGPAVTSTMSVMTHPVFGREDHYKGLERPRYEVAREAAAFIDSLALPEGAVLVDVFLGYPIVLNSSNPRQFVITADRDFEAVVDDPRAFDVQYVLVPPGGGLGGLDAIERRWPGMYAYGAGLGIDHVDFTSPDQSAFRWRLWDIRPVAASIQTLLQPQ